MPNPITAKVRCKGAGKTDRCTGCKHADIHDIVAEDATTCLAWGLCRRGGKPKMQVRCDIVQEKK